LTAGLRSVYFDLSGVAGEGEQAPIWLPKTFSGRAANRQFLTTDNSAGHG
jgi:hypothetical protein